MNRIINASCERMRALETGSVHLTVTSPPYWNAIDYRTHIRGRGDDNYRTREGEADYEGYLEWLGKCFGEVLRVHAPGTFCAVVVGTVLLRSRHTPLPFHVVPLMEGLGWEFHQDIVWNKVTGGVKRAGSAIQHPYPGYYYPNIMTEYLLIFRKPGESKIHETRTLDEKESSRYPIDALFTREQANSVWHIAPVPPGQYSHPCPFPEEIPYRLIRLYSYQGDLVLDPFAGSGTTLKVAHHLGRRWVGFETERQYIRVARERIEQPLRLRDQLVATFQKMPLDSEGRAMGEILSTRPRRSAKRTRRRSAAA
jgi:site-specific DNA-methyltransferase (adenine-specific)